VLNFSPDIKLEKIPVPLPSTVLSFVMEGFGEVLQQTPLAVTKDPPSVVTFPPQDADDAVIDVTSEVVKEGVVTMVLNEISSP
jgi:hypothetical protein